MTLGTDAKPDHFEGEDVIITIEEEGKDTVLNMEGTVLKIGKSGGEASTTNVNTFGGKTFNYGAPAGKNTLTFDVVIKNSDWDRVRWSGSSAASLDIVAEQRSDKQQLRKRVIFWFCSRANHYANAGRTIIVPPKGGAILRRIYTDVKAVTFDWEFDSGEYKKGTMTLEFSSLDSDGYPNEFSQFTPAQGSTSLTVLVATAHKGTLTWSTTTPAWTGSYRT